MKIKNNKLLERIEKSLLWYGKIKKANIYILEKDIGSVKRKTQAPCGACYKSEEIKHEYKQSFGRMFRCKIYDRPTKTNWCNNFLSKKISCTENDSDQGEGGTPVAGPRSPF